MNYPRLPERLAEVQDRIAAAQARGGREGQQVTIVAVTKTHPAAAARGAVAAGLVDLAENRVQDLEEKVRELEGLPATWHLIGHLQRNKVRRALPLFDLLHSLDSERLAQEVSRVARREEITVRALVQVNPSREEAKGGFAPAEVVDAIGRMAELPGLALEGLMTMAPFDAEESILRGIFAATRELRHEIARQVPSFKPAHISMGMSGDYEIAVEEGSTIVRLGTVLFGARQK